MSKKVNLLYPTEHANGSVLPPGWYDREEIPPAAFILGFVYVPPDSPKSEPPQGTEGESIQPKPKGKNP